MIGRPPGPSPTRNSFRVWRLQTLRTVDQHDRGVHRGEHAVGVLGEVGVTGGVDEVDHVRLTGVALGRVLELPGGGRRGDAAVLLHVHPVRDGGLTSRLTVEAPASEMTRACSARASVKVDLPASGWRDDGERTAAVRLCGDRGV